MAFGGLLSALYHSLRNCLDFDAKTSSQINPLPGQRLTHSSQLNTRDLHVRDELVDKIQDLFGDDDVDHDNVSRMCCLRLWYGLLLDDEIFKRYSFILTTATSSCKRKRSALKRDQCVP